MRFAVLVWLSVLPVWGARRVGIVAGGQVEPPARYGIRSLERTLAAKGPAVVHAPADEPVRADFYVLAGLGRGAPQSLSIRSFDSTCRKLRRFLPDSPT